MFNNVNNNIKADLRKKNSIKDEFIFRGYSVESCMVILLVTIVLLFSILTVVATPNPNVLFGI